MMRRGVNHVATGLGVALVVSSATAQAQTDVQLWTQVGVRAHLAKRLQAHFDHHLRFGQDVSRLEMAAPEPAVRFKPLKWWVLKTSYRWEHERDNNGDLQPRHRVAASTEYRIKLEPFALRYRLQWQEQVRQQLDDGTPTRHVLRNRLGTSVEVSDFVEVYLSVESFQRIDARDSRVSAGAWQKTRLFVGTELGVQDSKIDIFCGLSLPHRRPSDPTIYIMGVGLGSIWKLTKDRRHEKAGLTQAIPESGTTRGARGSLPSGAEVAL